MMRTYITLDQPKIESTENRGSRSVRAIEITGFKFDDREPMVYCQTTGLNRSKDEWLIKSMIHLDRQMLLDLIDHASQGILFLDDPDLFDSRKQD